MVYPAILDFLAQATTQAAPAHWLYTLFTADSVAHAVLILSLVTAVGLALGSIRVFGISLGIAGVLFAGLGFAHFGFTINEHVMEFAREFGLILFVYTIGLQVGPGFLSSLRKAGLKLNLLAAAIVLLGVITTLTIVFVSSHTENHKVPVPVAVGLLSGGTTNTPSLAAAGQAIKEVQRSMNVGTPDSPAQPGIGYAIAYPFGVIGIIATMLLIRFFFRINVARENELVHKQQASASALDRVNLEVTNPNLAFTPIGAVPLLNQPGVVVSRVLQGGKPYVAQADTILHVGDILHIVGPRERLDQLQLVVGKPSTIDVKAIPSNITTRRLVVSKSSIIGKTIDELDFPERFNVTITRVTRAEIEIPATPDWRFQFGDLAFVVGTEQGIAQVAAELGDSMKKLDHPQVIPIFVGIALGVIFGSWPFFLPGIPAPVKLGLAGGPLLVAIILSRVGQIGPLSWYMSRSANFLMRELGIVLFLACVGLKAGHSFVDTLVAGQGFYWMGLAAIITFVPIFLVGIFARFFLKLNYVSLCGLLAGSMTDPPALAFANAMAGAETPSIAYATVYPLTMILRVISTQAIVLFFFR